MNTQAASCPQLTINLIINNERKTTENCLETNKRQSSHNISVEKMRC